MFQKGRRGPSQHQAQPIHVANRAGYLEGGAGPCCDRSRRGVGAEAAVGATAPWHCHGSVQTSGLGLSRGVGSVAFAIHYERSPFWFWYNKAGTGCACRQELWTLLAQQQTKSLRPSNDVPVLNDDFKRLTTDPRVTMFVLPLPSSSRPVAAPKATPAPKIAAAPKNNPNKKRKVTRAEKNCPEELKKYTLRLEGKGNICWSYNLSAGCSNTTSGTPAKCMRGFHVCAHCHKPGHSVTTCRSKPS